MKKGKGRNLKYISMLGSVTQQYYYFQYVKERFGLWAWSVELAPSSEPHASIKILPMFSQTKKLLQKTHFAHDAFLIYYASMT
jgi:hypothetical protein